MTPLVTLPHEPTCAWPCFDAEDEAAVLAVLRDGNVTTHPIIRALEQDYAAFTGRRHGLAHANGTTALMASFFALGLEPGDEVLVPTATFWASVLPMLWFGLVPVFCESEPDRLGPCPADMRRRVTPRTRAMVVVHLWGLPARMTELQRLARDHGLRIVEDASHAHGATWHDVPCGRLGDISVFSLQGDKLAPAGEGGMLLTDDRDLYDRAVCLGDITRIIELDTPARRFAATSFGVKTRMAPLSAALGRAQLAKLRAHNARRNGNHMRLSQALEALGFDTFLGPSYVRRTYFKFFVRHRDQACDVDALIERLRTHGCRVAAPRYPLLHQQPFFTEGHWRDVARVERDAVLAAPEEFQTTARENARLIRVPNFPGDDNGIIDQYAAAFAAAVD